MNLEKFGLLNLFDYFRERVYAFFSNEMLELLGED